MSEMRDALESLRREPRKSIASASYKAYVHAARIRASATAIATGKRYLAHVGLHHPQNAGDTALFVAVRQLFDSLLGRSLWSLESLRAEVTPSAVTNWNRHARGVVVGGGGLLLPDTNRNHSSGWQWNISLRCLRALHPPLILFALGYNRFRGQEEFSDVFSEHISETVQRSAFFGLRNHGSIHALRSYVEGSLTHRLAYQPCPTTLLGLLMPSSDGAALRRPGKRLALNCAFDRGELRFGGFEDRAQQAIARAMSHASQRGWTIDLVGHMPGDRRVAAWLETAGVRFRDVNLFAVPARQVVHYYSQVPLTIGMRGHAQLIPFGLGNGIVSLVTHDKLKWFLDDIGHPEWGLETHASDLDERVVDAIENFEAQPDTVFADVQAARAGLWDVTVRNLRQIASALG